MSKFVFKLRPSVFLILAYNPTAVHICICLLYCTHHVIAAAQFKSVHKSAKEMHLNLFCVQKWTVFVHIESEMSSTMIDKINTVQSTCCCRTSATYVQRHDLERDKLCQSIIKNMIVDNCLFNEFNKKKLKKKESNQKVKQKGK